MPEAALLPRPALQPTCRQRPQAVPDAAVFAQRKATVPDEMAPVVAPPRDAGRSLEPSVRSKMENAFERDFSAVRVHDDAAAHDSARAINARAYSAGNDIVFGEGAYRPNSTSGRALLAHELAHSVQQGGVQMKSLGPLPAARDGELEREADRAALAVTGGRSTGPLTRVGRPAVFKAEGDPPAAAGAGNTPNAGPADDSAGTPVSEAPSNYSIVKEDPAGPGATTLVVQMGTLKMPRVKGKGPWVEQAYKARASGGGLVFTPKFQGGGNYGAAKSIAAYSEKPREQYKNVWLNNYGFKTLSEMAKAFKKAATAENADPEVKTAYEDPAAKKIIGAYTLSNNLPPGGCDIDHIVEKQLGGTSTPGNLQLLVYNKNQESGRETYKHLKAEIDRVLSPNRLGVVNFQMRFNDVQLMSDEADGSYVVEKVLRSGKVKGSEEVAATAGGTAISLEAGGNREVVYGRNGEKTDIGMGDRTLIPGLVLKTYERGIGSNASRGIDRIEAELNIKPAIPGDKPVSLLAKVTSAPKADDGSGGQSAEKKAAAAEFRKAELDNNRNAKLPFHYPYLSPGTITSLTINDKQELAGTAVIKPHIGFLGDLNVEFSPSVFKLSQKLDIEKLNGTAAMKKVKNAFRFTGGSLDLDLREFKPSGALQFTVGPEQKPLMNGDITAGVENGNFIATGNLQPGEGLPGAKGTTGQIQYHSALGWSGELALPPKIDILPNATVTGKLGFKEGSEGFSPYADGSMDANILGQKVQFAVGWSRKAGTVSYSVTVPIENPFPLVDKLTLSAFYTGGEMLFFNGEANVNWKEIVTGSGKISYTIEKGKAEGWYYGKVAISFKHKKLAGGGEAVFGDKGISSITATCSYQLTDEITAEVRVKYSSAEGKKVEDRFFFTGSVDVSSIKLFDPWPKKPVKKTFLDLGYTQYIPVPPFPAVSISLSMTGELGAKYQFGPGTIGGKITASGYLLSDDPRIKASLEAALKIPAFGELYGKFGVKVGAAVAQGLVGAEGGVYLTPSIRLDLLGSMKADATYEQGKGISFGGIAKVDGSLTGKLAVDAAVRVYFMRGLAEKEWLIPINEWGPVKLIDNFTVTLGKMSYSSWKNPRVTWPSLSDISISPAKYSPMEMIKGMLKDQKKDRESSRQNSEHVRSSANYAKRPLY